MSPEQIETGEIDRRSDIFAVGAVFYELLSYSEAFSGASTRQIENKVLQAQPAPLASLVPDLDPEIAAIVTRALEKDPAKRYQDAAAMEEALEQQRWRLGRLDTPAPTAASDATAAERRTQVPRLTGGGGLSALGCVLSERGRSTPPGGSRLKRSPKIRITKALTRSSNGSNARNRIGGRSRDLGACSAPPPGTEIRTALEPPARPADAGAANHRQPARGILPAPPSAKRSQNQTMARAMEPLPHGRAGRRSSSPLRPALRSSSCASSVPRRFPVSCSPSRSRPGARLRAAASTAARRGLTARPPFRMVSPSSSRPSADTGFMFTGYTGDCLSTGRTLMTSPRTCGGTFAPLPERACTGGSDC